MMCDKCGNERSTVTNSRAIERVYDGRLQNAIIRTRKCKQCAHVYFSCEVVMPEGMLREFFINSTLYTNARLDEEHKKNRIDAGYNDTIIGQTQNMIERMRSLRRKPTSYNAIATICGVGKSTAKHYTKDIVLDDEQIEELKKRRNKGFYMSNMVLRTGRERGGGSE